MGRTIEFIFDGCCRQLLLDNGKITALEAKIKAENEFDKFRLIQDKNYQSSFDKYLEQLEDLTTNDDFEDSKNKEG